LKSKVCNTCHISKPLSEFNRDSHASDGRRSRCSKCRNKARRETEKKKYTYKVFRGMVYCVECEGFYKIGVTSYGIRKRLQSIQTGNPFEVKILWVARTNDIGRYERIIHNQIKDNNVRGEWYDIPRVLALELRKQVKHDS
jgi:hypothetical protein